MGAAEVLIDAGAILALLGSRTQMEAVWGLLESVAISMATIENMELSQISGLMARYKDRPMDFADATPVYLAERQSIQTVLTVDQKDFRGYRIGPKKAFHLWPVERP